MRQAKHGDTVKVHYRGKLHNGSVFDASFGREPLEFTIGEGEVIPGLEDAVLGMHPGDSKTTELPAEKGFGPRREDLIGGSLKASSRIGSRSRQSVSECQSLSRTEHPRI